MRSKNIKKTVQTKYIYPTKDVLKALGLPKSSGVSFAWYDVSNDKIELTTEEELK